jgi:glutaryl-CoA dehydrogenase
VWRRSAGDGIYHTSLFPQMFTRIIKSHQQLTKRSFSNTIKALGGPGPAKFVKFDWKDPFNIEGELTEEEISIRDVAHQYCQSKLLPRVIKANREESKN